ncbi:hypothetical protein IGI04_042336 [Brassica rapa subsp. trilocularis]|uniref:Uncharacterized protein n=1 Tax=Brassica rapa subsp. trilocularis TaxID=1813537 RepID=A0ABQ7KK93_BRACM|nr:hypothetical protein IGI04_042336 [Brassica rapa subsp. trilocularis]
MDHDTLVLRSCDLTGAFPCTAVRPDDPTQDRGHDKDCSGYFGQRGLTIQYTQDVHGCPLAHTGRLTLTLLVDCSGDFGPRGLTVQYTQDVRGCPLEHTGPHIGRLWLSISTHISTLVLGLSTLTLPVDCSGDFGPRGLSVQNTKDVRGCPLAHTGRPCASVSTHRTSVCVRQHTQDVRGCPSVHISARWSLYSAHWPFPWTVWVILAHVGCLFSTHRTFMGVRQHTQNVSGCPCVSVSTHISMLVLGLSTLALPLDCSGDFGPRGLSFQYTQDVRGCPLAHTECPWLSVCVRVCPSAHTGHPWLSISTHISTLVLGLSTLALPVDCLGNFGTRGLSVQYTQDVRGCQPAHTGRPWLSFNTHKMSVAVRVCPSTHTGRPWLSISTHISMLVLGLSTLALPVDCSGDFGPRGLSLQYTQDVRRCPSAHTGRPCVSVSTHRTSVCVRQHTHDVRGCPSVHISARCTHRTSVGVHQRTQDVRVCQPAHTGRPWLSVNTHKTSVAVRVCQLAHTGRPWLSISTHISMLVLGLSTLALPVDCSGDFGPRGLSFQYTQDVRGCPLAHTECPWLSVCVRVCPSAHTGHPWLSISTHISTLVLGLSTLALPVDCLGNFGTRGLSVQYTQDVRGCQPAHTGRPWLSFNTHKMSVAVRVCPSTHTGRPWLSISTHISMLVLGLSTLALPVDCSGDFGPRGLPFQYTQDVRRCPSAHTGRPCVSVSTHRTTLTLPVDCSGDFGPRGLSFKYTQDVRRCPSAHTGRPCVFVSTHRTSVCVRQHTQDVCGCPSVHIPARWSLDSARWAIPWTVRVILAHVGCVFSTHRTSVGVCQHTQDVRGCPCVFVCVCQHAQDVRVRPSAHTGRPCVSVSTHRTTHSTFVGVRQHTQNVRGCPCVSVSTHRRPAVHQYTYQHAGPWTQHAGPFPVDCSGDFGPCGLSVQYTQDVRGCPSAHTGRSCVSVSTHRTSVAVRVCPCVSVSTHRTTHRTSVGVHQRTQNVRVCQPAHTGRPWLSVNTHKTSVAVRVCQSAHTGRPWLSISTHISMLVLGLSTLALPVDCSGDFGPHGLSFQYTQDVCGCPLAHTECPWLSVCVRVCPSAHTGRPWLSISTHISTLVLGLSTLVLGLSTLALPVDCLGNFGTRGLSVQYTQDVRGCQPAHTGRPWLSFNTHKMSVAVRVCLSTHTRRPWLSISTHISMLVLGLSTLALPVDCSGDFGPRGLPFQYTQDVRRCPSAHTGRPCVSVSTHRTSVCVRQHTQDVHGCPSVHISARWTSVGVHQHTLDVRVCSSAHTGRPWLSISTHTSTLVLGLSTLGHPVDCSGDFGPRGLCVQYTQDVRGCPPAHTGRPWLSVCVRLCLSARTGRPCASVSTHRTSVCVRQHTQDVRCCPSVHISARWSLDSAHWPFPWTVWVILAHVGCLFSTHRTFVGVRQHTQNVRGCPCVSVSTHRTSVAVHQYTYQHAGPWTQHAGPSRGLFGTHRTSVGVHQRTQDVRVCQPAHTGRLWLSVNTHKTSVAVRVCQSAHTGRPWLSISTHISMLVLGLSTLALPVDCSGDFGPHGLSFQYTQDVCGCPLAHTECPWLSVCVRVCPSAHTGRPWLSISTHISTLVLGLSTLALPVDCLGNFGTRGLSVQYTQDVRGCQPAHTGRPWLSFNTHKMSVAVRVCPSTHTGRPWLSISTHISMLVLGLSTLALPVDCSGDFGPRGLSLQYTQDVRRCPSAHTGRPCVSVSTHRTSVCVRQHTHDVRGCPSVHISARCTHRTSVGVHQRTQDVRVCQPAHTGRPWLSVNTHKTSVAVRVCQSAHTGRPWLSISTHISMLVLGLSTLALPVDCSGDFGPHGLSFQYTQDVCGCPLAHTECPWLSVCVRVCPSAHTGRPWLSISTHISTLVLGLSTLALPVDCLGNFGTRGLSVQYTQDVRGVSQHTGRPWLSFNTHKMSVAVRVCPSTHTGRPWLSISTHISMLVLGLSTLALPVDCSGYFGPRGLSLQYTQDVRRCPSAHTGRPCVSVSTHRTSVCVRQHTQDDVRVCQPAHTGRPWLSVNTHKTYVAVRVCQSAHTGRPWLSISAHISILVLGLSTLALPVDCSGDFGPRGLSFQYTQDVRVCLLAHTECPWLSVCVRVCPSAHTGRPWLSISTHISTLVLGLSTLALPVDCLGNFGTRGLSVQYTQDVRGCQPAHTGRPWLAFNTHKMSVAVCVCPSTHTGRPLSPQLLVSKHNCQLAPRSNLNLDQVIQSELIELRGSFAQLPVHSSNSLIPVHALSHILLPYQLMIPSPAHGLIISSPLMD